jgi:hypothetical protein
VQTAFGYSKQTGGVQAAAQGMATAELSFHSSAMLHNGVPCIGRVEIRRVGPAAGRAFGNSVQLLHSSCTVALCSSQRRA